MPRAKPGRPKTSRLSREQISRAALRLIQQTGTEKLSLRLLARELRVDAMALYHYFPHREALLLSVFEQAFAGLPRQMPAGVWQSAVTELMVGYYEIARRHAGLVDQLIKTGNPWPEALRSFNDLLLTAITRSGAERVVVELVRDILVDYTHGFLLAEPPVKKSNKAGREATYRRSLNTILGCL